MNYIPEYMITKHRECDDTFTEAEAAVVNNNWLVAEAKWQCFVKELEVHLRAEEIILFPQFEQATGIVSGPTMVMRSEHEQMRSLVEDANKMLAAQNKDEFLGRSETLMILMQQHNMKEEMMLYPMCQQRIPHAETIAKEIQQYCDEQLA